MPDAELCRRLQAAMDAACASGEECGCQLTIYRHGELVCDLCAGWTTPEKKQRVTPRTLFPVFSVGKGVVTTLVHILAERGLVDYDGKVADLWPEYAANGKKETAVYELLSHRAGLYEFPADMPFYDWFDWGKAVARLAAMAPLDRIGGMHHYHGMTFGVLAGHLAECASGRELRALLKEEIFDKLGIDSLFFGLPESRWSDLAPIDGSGFPPDRRTDFNAREVLCGLNPSANGTANAASLAKMYAALLPSGLGGVRLLSEATVARATTLCRAPEDTDLARWDKFGLGYALCGPPGDLGRMFGHGGACGAEGFADRKTGYAVGFTKNRLNATHPVHPLRNELSAILGIPARVW